MADGYIYKITSPNNKVYIGQTVKLISRKNNYKNNHFKKQIKLWRNCQKYNWNPIDTFEIIEQLPNEYNKFLINLKEQYWIDYYDSYNNGLNCNEGGNGNVGHKHSEETKKRISDKIKGSIVSEETKIKIKESTLKNKREPWNKGKQLSQIQKNGFKKLGRKILNN